MNKAPPTTIKVTSRRKVILGVIIGVVATIILALIIGEIVVALRSKASKKAVNCEPQANASTNANWASANTAVRAFMDDKADPCGDFYQYACGGFLSTQKIPSDSNRWGVFSTIEKSNVEIKKKIMTAGWPLVGPLYSACMNDAGTDRGVAVLQPYLDVIDALDSSKAAIKTSIAPVLATLHKMSVGSFFSFSVDSYSFDPAHVIVHLDHGGITLSRTYYVDERLKGKAETAIKKLIHDAMDNLGMTLTDEQVSAIYTLEALLAVNEMPTAQRRNPYTVNNIRTIAEVVSMTGIDFSKYFADIGVQTKYLNQINVVDVPFMEKLGDVMVNNSDTVKNYLKWRVVNAYGSYLGDAMKDIRFAFKKTMYGVEARSDKWKECMYGTASLLGELVGHYFVQEAFSEEQKNEAKHIIKSVENQFATNIRGASWLDATTKTRALAKLKAITDVVGYPDKWDEYNAIVMDKDKLFEAAKEMVDRSFEQTIKKLDKPLDKSEWFMTPDEVNAYYNPAVNGIVIPAGILRGHFYNPEFPLAMKYGGIGSVVGHELTHGFDDQGAQFDLNGNLSNWWTAESYKQFKEKAKCVVDLYSSYTVLNGSRHLNGSLTNGENIADMGGVKTSFGAFREAMRTSRETEEAIKKSFSMTADQLYFVSYAQNWCTLYKPERITSQILTDPHSPGRYRVVGPLSNFDEFHKAFSCKSGSYMNPTKQCSVW